MCIDAILRASGRAGEKRTARILAYRASNQGAFTQISNEIYILIAFECIIIVRGESVDLAIRLLAAILNCKLEMFCVFRARRVVDVPDVIFPTEDLSCRQARNPGSDFNRAYESCCIARNFLTIP